MRKKNLKTYAVAAALAAILVGVPASPAYAEEAATEVATEEAVTVDTLDKVEAAEYFDGGSNHYSVEDNGGSWDGTYYTLNGKIVKNVFFTDGTYTYYLQNDGTAMKDRLTYHPDGKHIIYFDANGHEVFSDFANVKKSIAGDAVDDLCFFDVYGYMYVNKLTYDKEGKNLYYVNKCGVIERNGWFQFASMIKGLNDTDYAETYKGTGGNSYGYANADGALMTSQWTYNGTGGLVYLQADGSLITGIQNMGGTYYMFDMGDGHVTQTYTQPPATYSYTYYYGSNGNYCVETYDGMTNQRVAFENYNSDGILVAYGTFTYDANGNEIKITDRQINRDPDTHEYLTNSYLGNDQYMQYNESGQLIYSRSEGLTEENGTVVIHSVTEEYYDNGNGIETGARMTFYDSDGSKSIWEYDFYEDGAYAKSIKREKYDADGNLTSSETEAFNYEDAYVPSELWLWY